MVRVVFILLFAIILSPYGETMENGIEEADWVAYLQRKDLPELVADEVIRHAKGEIDITPKGVEQAFALADKSYLFGHLELTAAIYKQLALKLHDVDNDINEEAGAFRKAAMRRAWMELSRIKYLIGQYEDAVLSAFMVEDRRLLQMVTYNSMAKGMSGEKVQLTLEDVYRRLSKKRLDNVAFFVAFLRIERQLGLKLSSRVSVKEQMNDHTVILEVETIGVTEKAELTISPRNLSTIYLLHGMYREAASAAQVVLDQGPSPLEALQQLVIIADAKILSGGQVERDGWAMLEKLQEKAEELHSSAKITSLSGLDHGGKKIPDSVKIPPSNGRPDP